MPDVDGISPAELCGSWALNGERVRIIEIHTQLLWGFLRDFPLEARQDRIVRREMTRMFDESLWAATEIRVNLKYDIRYVSLGVILACERRGLLTDWAGSDKAVNAEALIHEHVQPRKLLREQLFGATSPEEISRILSSAEGCVVTRGEHARLGRGECWDRYAHADVPVWDRVQLEWRTDCGRPPGA